MAKDNDHLRRGTKIVNAGRKAEWTGPVVNPPVWRASTHLYPNMAAFADDAKRNEDGQFFYGRRGAPTQWALSDALTKLEPEAYGTILYPSGVAALSGALMSVLKPGDVLLVTDNAYEPTRMMGLGILKQFGIETRFFDPLDLDGFAGQFCPRTKAVMLESPGSLTMEVCDIPAMAGIARGHGAVSLIDNTWASSLGLPALQLGCDIAIMSLTKHVGGHSDLMMGSASAGKRYYAKLRKTAQALGHVVSPDDASLALRGLRTMPVRLDKSSDTALKIAQWLAEHPQVSHVLCPMLPGAPGYELWKRDFSGGCGLFSFVLKSADQAGRARFIDALELFGLGYSWGGFESLAIPVDPAPIRSGSEWPPKEWGAGEHLAIRLSIGLEDAEDLLEDLQQGFAAMERI